MSYGPGFRRDPQGRVRWSENGRWTEYVRDPGGTIRRDGNVPVSSPPSSSPLLGVDPPRREGTRPTAGSGGESGGGGAAIGGAVVGVGGVGLFVVFFLLVIFLWQLRWILLIGWLAMAVAGVLLYRRGRLRGRPLVFGVVAWITLGCLCMTGFGFQSSYEEGQKRTTAEESREEAELTAREISATQNSLARMADDPHDFCSNRMSDGADDALAEREGTSSCSEAVEGLAARLGPTGLHALSGLEMTKISSVFDEDRYLQRSTFQLGPNPLGWTRIEMSVGTMYGFVIHSFQ
ncbi:hypothetical protein IMZ11_05435 [Microtetraspora sp. AC03309]|uniref:hypothetical protein n=1 Tax=Microtetraspora sp. AC03309 TaxID=2779376 RepID=UPI001E63D628|nr:hypothetical protein [Microtetraspora sp. AC03309]MCC5575081.1 hypothetical protein [Microtetraspora sp. AC03309]